MPASNVLTVMITKVEIAVIASKFSTVNSSTILATEVVVAQFGVFTTLILKRITHIATRSRNSYHNG